jgi:hypothetical protein
MAYMILLIYSLLLAQLSIVQLEISELHDRVFHRNRQNTITDIIELVQLHKEQFGQYPLNLEALNNTSGYELTSALYNQLPNIIYKKTALTNTTITYHRIIIATQGKYDVVDDSTYLSNNQCGTTPFTHPAIFCPDGESLYFISETTSGETNELTATTIFLNMTIAKLAKTINSGTFYNAGLLSNGEAATLAALVGYAGPSETCSGPFIFNNQSLDCHDLFSPFPGNKITYNYINAKHIALHVSLSSKDATGNPRFVIRDVKL